MTTRDSVDWILASDEPWTRYRALRDIVGRPEDDSDVMAARTAMVEHPAVTGLLEQAAGWPGYPLKRHNDAAHPLYAIATLADFGLSRDDSGVGSIAESILEHFDGQGFETLLWLPKFLTKEEDTEQWSWMLCDSPTLLYALLAFGYGAQTDVETAVNALAARVADNGWRCGAADSIPKFGGPGRKDDTCPIATVYSLKALSQVPALRESPAVEAGVAALHSHWEHQRDYKLKMFGIGTDFRKLKYPFVWYDILHVVDVVSRYPQARRDPRLHEMVAEIEAQADENGRYTAGSMYRAWKDWSFADKKQPSPWLTMVAARIQTRVAD
ncbi:MAG: hypothetical protein QNJ89_08155 [Acidimicrobiia bacterium]|nr:hypothetical protein [Acidimicrobiia bacterium]